MARTKQIPIHQKAELIKDNKIKKKSVEKSTYNAQHQQNEVNKDIKPNILKRVRKHRSKVRSQITKCQRDKGFMIPKITFQRLIREIAEKYYSKNGLRFTKEGLIAAQASGEQFMTDFFRQLNNTAYMNRMTTILPRHVLMWAVQGTNFKKSDTIFPAVLKRYKKKFKKYAYTDDEQEENEMSF